MRIPNLKCLLMLFLVVFTSGLPCKAQTISDTLQEVQVSGKRKISSDDRVNEFIPGQKITTIDSQTLQQYSLRSMAGLLDQQTSVFVKSYGYNSLATLALRGASAAQSAVYWNGVPVAQASMGIADLSTIPVFFINRASLVMGSNSALWGSGNVGGALLLENAPPCFDTSGHRLVLAGGAGSYGQNFYGMNASLWNGKWFFGADFYRQTALNNFRYTDLTGNALSMTNSTLISNAIQVHLAYKISERQQVGVFAWLQQYDREIPPAMFESVSLKRQKDNAVRVLADWHLSSGYRKFYARLSLNRDELVYTDGVAGIIEKPVSVQYYAEAGWERTWSNTGKLMLFVPVLSQFMWQSQGTVSNSQNRTALAGVFRQDLFSSRLQIAVNGREETYSGKMVFCPGADAGFMVWDWLCLRANMQQTYRIPSLNELFYWPGGNPSLRPEQGWNEDLGYHFSYKWGRVRLTHDLDWFNRNIHDWILWLGGALWTPYNIAAVHSRGVETDNCIDVDIRHWNFQLGVNTSYVLATTVSSYIPNDGSIGQQLPYTPRYNYRFNFIVVYKRLELGYNHTYTGYRFLTMDGSEYLQPYQTGNLRAAFHTHVYSKLLQLHVQCNNIWNAQYQVVAYRPMPRTNWLAGISLQIL